MAIAAIDIGIIACYFVAVLGLGFWIARRKMEGGDDFFLASKEMSWPLIGASLFSTNISSQQFVGQAGKAFAVGLVIGNFQLIGAFCFILLGVFFIDVYMGLRLHTSPEFFERRYNAGCRKFVSLINLLGIIAANLAAALYAGGLLLTELLGWDVKSQPGLFWLAVVILAATTGAYTLMGGLKSVIYTDFLQTLILIGGGVLILALGLDKVGGLQGLSDLRDSLEMSKLSLYRPAGHELWWFTLITGVLILGVHGHCTDHDYVQRALAAKSAYHAKMGCVLASFLKVAALFIIAMPGVIAAELFPEMDSGDKAYVRMLTELLPIGVKGLCVAGLIAAIMSSVDSGLCACSSLLAFDFIVGKKQWSERRMLWLGRWLVLGLLALAIVIAPNIKKFGGLFDYLIQIWSLTAPPVFVCVVFGLFSRRVNGRGALATLIVGLGLGIAMFIVLSFPFAASAKSALPAYWRNSMNVGFGMAILCTAILFGVSAATGMSPDDLAKADAIRGSRRMEPMSAEEKRKFRLWVAAMLLLIVAVIIIFSPLGIAK